MRSVPKNPEHKLRYVGVPIRVFHGLRRAIGEVFVENGEPDIQQQFGAPPSLPDWLDKGLNYLKLIFKSFI